MQFSTKTLGSRHEKKKRFKMPRQFSASPLARVMQIELSAKKDIFMGTQRKIRK